MPGSPVTGFEVQWREDAFETTASVSWASAGDFGVPLTVLNALGTAANPLYLEAVDQDRPVAADRIVEGAVAEGDDVLGHYFEFSLVDAPSDEGSQCGG